MERIDLLTPPNSPHSQQRHIREDQRQRREYEQGSPRCRRVPDPPDALHRNREEHYDENIQPARLSEFQARSQAQRRRQERERRQREQRVPDRNYVHAPAQSTRALAQQARRARERAEKQHQREMDIDGPVQTAARERLPLREIQPTRSSQNIHNGLFTPPNTQGIPALRPAPQWRAPREIRPNGPLPNMQDGLLIPPRTQHVPNGVSDFIQKKH
ncbi:hypothetical protein B0H14DRAFT_2557610 [Mycena olivaceomarginata]|nr:hypothetical protein B0H14DRAFT_2557610 [Mycena olivaceomarginata]